MFVLRKSSLFLVLSSLILLVWGCDERRFAAPKRSKRRPIIFSKKVQANPKAPIPRNRPAKAPIKSKVKLVLENLDSHAAGIRAIAVDPSGAKVLTGGTDRQLILWRLPKGKKIRSWHHFRGVIRSIAMTPDGRRFAFLEGKKNIFLRSIRGKLIKSISTERAIREIAFAPVLNRLLALTEDGNIIFFHSTKLTVLQKIRVCPAKTGALHMALDYQERWIGVACNDGVLSMLGWQGKKRFSLPSLEKIEALAFSPNQPLMVTGDKKGGVSLWSIQPKTLKIKREFKQYAHVRAITHLSFSPNGKNIAVSSLDHHGSIWNISPKKIELKHRLPHNSAVTTLHYVPGEKVRLLTGDERGGLSLWTDLGELIFRKSEALAKGRTLSFAPHKLLLITDAEKGALALWDLKKLQRTFSPKIHLYPLLQTSISTDGNHMISVDAKNVVFWDFRARHAIAVVGPPKKGWITAATLGKDWTQVFFGCAQKGVRLWTIVGPRRLFRRSEPRCVTAVAHHAKTTRGVAVNCEGMLHLYDFRRYRLMKKVKLFSESIYRVYFSPKGDRILTLTQKGVSLWSVPKLKKLAELSLRYPILTAAFSPRSALIALGSADRSIYLWNPADKKVGIGFEGCRTPVRNIQFAPNRSLLAATCYDGSLQLWEEKTKKLIATFMALPDKDWISYSPSLFYTGSVGAFLKLFFRSGNKKFPLNAFNSWFFSPLDLDKRLRSFVKPSIKR